MENDCLGKQQRLLYIKLRSAVHVIASGAARAALFMEMEQVVNVTMHMNNETEWVHLHHNIINVRNDTSVPVTAPPSVEYTVTLGIILGCIILVTIIGNLLVLLAVYVNSHLRSTTNFFIVNLAVADLLLGITVLPFSATLETLQYWPFGYVVCNVWASADVLWCTASIWTLCVISIDRYIGVTRPLQHSTIITEKRAVYIIVFVWVLSLAISIAPLIGWKEKGNNSPNECTVTKQVGYVIFSVSGSFYIPTLITVIVYMRIYREATRHSKYLSAGSKTTKIAGNGNIVLRIHTGRNSHSSGPQNYQSSSSSEHSECSSRKISAKFTPAGKMAKFKKEKKAAKTLGIVVGVFLMCWFPFFFCLPLDVLCTVCEVPSQLFNVIFWLGYCNSLMNPIIYATSSKEFKRAFIRVLKCQYDRKPRLFPNRHGHSRSDTELRQYNTIIRRYSRSKSQSFSPHSSMGIIPLTLPASVLSRSNSDSPMASLRVFQDRRKGSSHSSNFEQSEKSSYSDLADDENSEILLPMVAERGYTCNDTRPQCGSFEKDEDYINAFKNLQCHTML